MRPEVLFSLFAPITTLSGVGPRFAQLFERLAGPNIIDLCWHLPSGLIDRRYAPQVAAAEPGRIATLRVFVEAHNEPHNRRQPYRVFCHDDSGEITLVFFHARRDYLQKILPIGAERIISGKVELFSDRLQMTHPDHVGPLKDLAQVQRVEPTYPLTAGLSQKQVRKAVTAAIAQVPDLPEWCDAAYLKQQNWPSWKDALLKLHAPAELVDLEPTARPRKRLAFDELLANQLALALMRQQQVRQKGRAARGTGRLCEAAIKALPYELTGSQKQATEEIRQDMASADRMLRLLQGDVGSGKTVVALLSMLTAVEAGSQAALMAPTEILARQHFKTLAPLLDGLDIRAEILTGREKGKSRQEILTRLASGETQIAVGTHALFQEDVDFHDLALAVIDEQHRFGVHQRLMLTSKGAGVDVLVMTATPIPRTLVLTSYGDMAVSRLTEKPAGRLPVDTRVLSLERMADVIEGVQRALAGGNKVYWVCPLVQESEVSDLAAAEDRYADLKARFGEAVGLVHGRMKGAEKDAVMAAFSGGGVNLLIATTVIEVGVDVPAATVMVIEHAERFGLAQLHQLRGRIGRGSGRSTCLLLYQGPLGETARARLTIMRETEDGFRIAEEDLRLRGAGELLGTRQSGFPEFRVADLAVHDDLLTAARDDAQLIMERDNGLKGPRGEALRVLLYLFERDAAVRLLQSG